MVGKSHGGTSASEKPQDLEELLSAVGCRVDYNGGREEVTLDSDCSACAEPRLLSPAPHRKEKVRSWLSVGAMTGLAVVGLLVLAIILNGILARDKAGAMAGSKLPVFSRTAYRTIEPGITDQGLRDRLGLPAGRRPCEGRADREEWVYTESNEGGMPQLRLYVVVLEQGRLIGKREARAPIFGQSDLVWAMGGPREARPLWAVGGDGILLPFGSTVDPVHVFSYAGLEFPVEQLAKEGCVHRFEVYNLSRFGPGDGSPATPDPGLAARKTVLLQAPVGIPPLCVYVKGWMYPLPYPAPEVGLDSYRKDLAWLLKRLGESALAAEDE